MEVRIGIHCSIVWFFIFVFTLFEREERKTERDKKKENLCKAKIIQFFHVGVEDTSTSQVFTSRKLLGRGAGGTHTQDWEMGRRPPKWPNSTSP